MITKELAKQLIEQAEYNCSCEKVEYNIDDILPLSEDGAYLVLHHLNLARHLLSATKMERLIFSETGRVVTL